MPITHFLRTFFTVLLSVFVFSLSYASAKEMTQAERNEMAAKLIPIITMLLMDGDSTPPLKPSLTTPLGNEVNTGTVSVEVNGEVGAKVFANGVQVGVIGSSGKATVVLTFVNGVNAMSITLQDSAGNESDPLTFSVSYDAPPVITLNGEEDTYVVVAEGFTDLGAVAIDANDGSIPVNVSGIVDDTIVGDYNLTYTASDSKGSMATKIRRVHILPAGASSAVLPMDLTKVEGFNGATDPSQLAGEVQNQYWVQAFGVLTEVELSALVSNYPIVTIVGYSDTYGLLVEIPLDNVEAKSAIKTIELEEKVLNVRHRLYLGSDYYNTNSITLPNDDVSGYYDGGDNWHLEYIDILSAWEITTGSSEVAVGVVDAGFYANHEDITIKTRNNLSKGIKDSHGTAVASIIAADTNNGKGITGINWSSPLVVSIFKDFDANISFEPENYFRDIFELSEDHSKVKLVNCSFGPHPSKPAKAYSKTRKTYDAIQKYKNKLFIYSAGNDHNNTLLGIGALHDDGFGNNGTKEDNILIVAALLEDGRLPEYSNYGDTVDIAAPTMMKAARDVSTYYNTKAIYYGTTHTNGYILDETYDNNKSYAFGGTSAAAPVVTGVAALIYSLNPDFTPQEVKKILIDSTNGHKTCIRHKVFDYTDETVDEIETIPVGHCIPVLNAGAALTLTKKIVEAKEAHLLHYYPSVFSNLCNVYIKPPTAALQIGSLDLTVQGRKVSDNTWETINIQASSSTLTELADNTHELSFPTDNKYSEYNITGILTYTGYAPINIGLIIPHTLIKMHVDIKDRLLQTSLQNVEMVVDYLNIGDDYVFKRDLDVDDNITLYLEPGTGYKVIVKKATYKDGTEMYGFGKSAEQEQSRTIELVSDTVAPAGNLIVLVQDENATSIANATVLLASSSTTINNIPSTGSSGIARILDIPILDINDAFIEYTLEVVRAGYLTETVVGVGLVDGKSPLLRIVLQKDPNYTNTPPAANAGADVSIAVGESVTLSGELSSDDETPTQYLQYKWSGATIATSYEQNVTLLNLSEGTYTFTLEVTDEEGAVATDTVTVTVAPSSGSTLKKTGQTTSYADYDDGYYQKGVTPSYSRANEVVTDNVTGLQWQDNAEAKTVTKTWDEAQTYCSSLGLDGGGWRLPTVQELQSIVVGDTYSPSIDTLDFVNYTIFSFYWSSTTFAGYTSFAWYVDFYNGLSDGYDYYDKSYTNGVRCVR